MFSNLDYLGGQDSQSWMMGWGGVSDFDEGGDFGVFFKHFPSM